MILRISTTRKNAKKITVTFLQKSLRVPLKPIVKPTTPETSHNTLTTLVPAIFAKFCRAIITAWHVLLPSGNKQISGLYKITSPTKYTIERNAVFSRVLSARSSSIVIKKDKPNPTKREAKTGSNSIPIYIPLLQLVTMILGFIALYFSRKSDPRGIIFAVFSIILGLIVLVLLFKSSINPKSNASDSKVINNQDIQSQYCEADNDKQPLPLGSNIKISCIDNPHKEDSSNCGSYSGKIGGIEVEQSLDNGSEEH